MSLIYENYIWRLSSNSPVFEVQLPQDLKWVDEVTWSPVQQSTDVTLSGALVVQESKQLKGRPITLQGKTDMGWIKRSTLDTLLSMRLLAGFVMNLQYVEYFKQTDSYGAVHPDMDFNVMFRHYDPPVIEADSVKGFDDYDPETYFIIKNLRFMEAIASANTPCSANVVLTISSLSGIFTVGDSVTGSITQTTGTVTRFESPDTLYVYLEEGEFATGETITGPTGSATIN